MTSPGSSLLLLAACLNAAAALAHVAVVLGGPAWYRAFGAGEGMARLAATGSWYPPAITLSIALLLAVWSAYALSATGLFPPLPFARLALLAITAVYLLRGVAGFGLAAMAPGGNSPTFWVWSSTICLSIGAVHAAGLVRAWPSLSSGQT